MHPERMEDSRKRQAQNRRKHERQQAESMRREQRGERVPGGGGVRNADIGEADCVERRAERGVRRGVAIGREPREMLRERRCRAQEMEAEEEEKDASEPVRPHVDGVVVEREKCGEEAVAQGTRWRAIPGSQIVVIAHPLRDFGEMEKTIRSRCHGDSCSGRET